MERTREEMQREVFDYAVKYWKSTIPSWDHEEMRDLLDADHIGYTLELLEEDIFNEAREEEAEKTIETVKALRVYGTIGKKIAVYFNDANRCFFSDEDLNEFAHEYNTDAETLEEMLNQLAEIIDDMRTSGYYAEEEILLYNEGKEHLKALATA